MVAALVFGCAEPECAVRPQPGVDGGPPVEYGWCPDDVPTVVVESCEPELRAALGAWGLDWPVVAGEVPEHAAGREGYVYVSRGDARDLDDGTPVDGRTSRRFELDTRRLLWASITVESCDEHVLVHEVGHAFGLGHADDPTDVMHESYDPRGPR